MTLDTETRPTRSRLPVLAGTSSWVLAVLVLALLTTSRWGSYLGWPERSVFLTDVALLFAGLLTLAWLLRNRAGWRLLLTAPMLPVGLLVAYAAFRLVTSNGELDAVRDAVPYLYGLVALMTLLVGAPRVAGWLIPVATVSHAAWVTASLEDPDLNYRMPTVGRTRIFELRTDFDATVAGVLAVVCALLAVSVGSWLLRVCLLAAATWSVLLVPAMNNRAGLLATALAAVWAGLSIYHRSRWRERRSPHTRRLVAAAAAGVLLVAGALVLVYTPAGQRLVGTFSDAPSSEQRTTDARIEVYKKVLDFVGAEPARQLVGVGFGRDYLEEIGAAPIYDPGGDLLVRSPHNFLLGTYARLGVLGALLQLLMVLWGYVLAWRATRTRDLDPPALLAAALLVALPVSAAVGVVLESPFGAVPYFWAYGVLVVRLVLGRTSESGGDPGVGSEPALSVR